MSLTHKLQELLRQDASLINVKRWSLRELAAHNSSITAGSSEQLLLSAVRRLARQHQSVQEWAESLKREGSDPSHFRNAAKRLDKLQYVHAETYKLGRQLLDSRTVWERFSDPDKHVVNATFLELRARHANTVETAVDVITDLRRAVTSNIVLDDTERQHLSALHTRAAAVFLQRRLGIHLLCDHHVELYKGKQPNGGVSVNAPLSVVLKDAVLEAQQVVDVHLQTFPKTIYPETSDITCTIVKPWVHHAFMELLKNAMASAVAKMKADKKSVPPPVHINIKRECDSSVIIDILDRGTGIANMEDAFALGHTSADRKWDRLDQQQSYAVVRSPMSSLGVGLPVSRYMMEHFGGSLTIQNNMDGAGCMARIRLLTDETILERIPDET